MYTFASWNVNSLRVRLGHLEQWAQDVRPDVIALQELKCTEEQFPFKALHDLGYAHTFALGQKSYNGVALLSRWPISAVTYGNPHFSEDPQARLISGQIAFPDLTVRLINGYFPNGHSVGSEKYAYKLQWLNKLYDWLADLDLTVPTLVVGDMNIAPADIDVHDPAAWADKILCSQPERDALARIQSLAFTDCFRALHPEQSKAFTWWDYRVNGFKRNLGLRIDLLLANAALQPKLRQCAIDVEPRGWQRPSDHAPVLASFSNAAP